MSDDAVRATAYSVEGEMEFQQYLVGRRCERTVWRIAVENADLALPNPAFEAALASTALGAIVVCHSNPISEHRSNFCTREGCAPELRKIEHPVPSRRRTAGGGVRLSGEIAVAEIEPDRSSLMTEIRACWSLSAEL